MLSALVPGKWKVIQIGINFYHVLPIDAPLRDDETLVDPGPMEYWEAKDMTANLRKVREIQES